MRRWSKSILTGGGILMLSMLMANIINLIFNIYLGRKIDLDDFSTITIINTMWYFISIFISALSSTLVQRTAFLTAKYNNDAANFFFKVTRNRAIIAVSLITGLFILLSPVMAGFFHLSSNLILLLVAPSLVAGTLLSLNNGYLTANLLFKYVAVLNLIEPIVKFVSAALLVYFGLGEYVFIAVPLSVIFASFISIIFIKFQIKPISQHHLYRFPKRFYFAALISGLSGNAFLVYDMTMVKHFLDPQLSGQYALLALVGKMIFFMGSLVNTFMLVLVTKDLGANRDPNKTFYRLMAGISVLTITSALMLGTFGDLVVPLLFGNKALAVLPYLKMYSFTIATFTIANAIVGYHLARKHYVFPLVAIILSSLMIFGILLYHGGISQIVQVMAVISAINLLVMIILHFVQRNGGFFIRNLLDLFALFSPLPKVTSAKSGKRILIFNWRDIKHVFAGGAEVYIHELAKRWVKEGNTVTIFCGNDGMSPRNETIDGVNIVRRGGFYLVYFWAFLYYMLRFRGKYDVILDCENGLPFFTPFYAKEKIFLVIHHVHQGVFRKSLNPLLGAFASFLEIKCMPIAYRNIKLITVSPSSKKDIMEFELTLQEPEIIYNGVDLQTYKPGIKSSYPLVIYVGRLKQYKTIEVFIKSAQKILKKVPETRFVIAGDGDYKKTLMQLVHSLNLQEKIEFLGKVTEKQKIDLFQRAWIAVNPSSMEGWGATVIEANACGTPVVASHVPGLMDSVKNPHTGYLVEHGNVDKFSNKILELIQDKDKRQRFSDAAIKWAKNFDWKKSADKSLDLFNRS